jgi:hypothetical protein
MLISKKWQVDSKKLQTQLSCEKSYQIKSDGKIGYDAMCFFLYLVSFFLGPCVFFLYALFVYVHIGPVGICIAIILHAKVVHCTLPVYLYKTILLS